MQTTYPQPSGEIPLPIRLPWSQSRTLVVAGLLHLALIPIFLVAGIIDPKIITGAPAWIKPLKFAISGAIYSFTFIWMLGYVTRFPRTARFAAGLTGVAISTETILIAMQVVRGTTSHYNLTTWFDARVFNVMGLFIMALSLMNLLLAIWLLFEKLSDPTFAWALRLGVISSFVGMGVAFLMTSAPSPAQVAEMKAGPPSHFGGHSVGVEDGGPGLPLVGWNTQGGDLRIPHFVGLHGMQVLPLMGWLLRRPQARRWSQGRRTVLVWIAGGGYLGLTALLTWQALRGQSIVAPDGLTLAALAGLVAAVVGSVALVLWNAKAEGQYAAA